MHAAAEVSANAEPVNLPVKSQQPSLIAKFAARLGVEPGKLMTTLKQTAFKQAADKNTGQVTEVSNEEMMALLIVADQYGLNPFTREIYAFKDRKRGGIVPVVGVDGWIRIVQEHPQFAGATFATGSASDGKLQYVECSMYRKDREHAMTIREYLNENKRDTDLWSGMPNRMLRHRAWIQTARLCFGFVGLNDEDEARQIIEGTVIQGNGGAIDDLNAEITGKPASDYTRPHEPDAAHAKPDVAPFAAVADAINSANNDDALNVAVDLIRSVADEKQRDELLALAAKRREAIEAGTRG